MGLGQITLNCTVIVERWVDDNISHLFFKIFFFFNIFGCAGSLLLCVGSL